MGSTPKAAKLAGKLTDVQIRNAKAKGGRQTKVFDGGGLHLLVTPGIGGGN